MSNSMKSPQGSIPKLQGIPKLSLTAVTEATGTIINAFDGAVIQGDVFYLVYPPGLSREATDIRNSLRMATRSQRREREINGVLYQQRKPITYWLSVPGDSAQTEVELAFYESVLFEDEDGATGWRLLKHCSEYPILRWYVPPHETAIYSGPTLTISETTEIEEKAFGALKYEIEAAGTSVCAIIHEPNGTHTFPDYSSVIGKQNWAIEITRPLGAIVHGRVINMGTPKTPSDVIRAAYQPGLDAGAVREALRKATEDKSDMKKLLEANQRYCLLLVDTIGAVDPENSEQWGECEFDAFDSVVLMWIVPGHPDRMAVIKGNIPARLN